MEGSVFAAAADAELPTDQHSFVCCCTSIFCLAFNDNNDDDYDDDYDVCLILRFLFLS